MSHWLRFSLVFLLFAPALSADVVSPDSDYVAGQSQITDKLNNDRHLFTNGINNIRGVYAGSVQSSGQIKADTVGEENMADDANPRIRTAENGSCSDYIYSGLLAATSSSLIGNISLGVGYPDGFRIEKTSSTAKTFTASKWTYGYIDIAGSFQYQEQTIGGTEPAQPANTAKLFRVSTDTTTINSVIDLRKTSCTAGPFSAISDAASEATLGDILKNGTPVRRFSPAGRTPQGFAQGAFVSWNTVSTFKVTAGALYINGKYRAVSTDTTITTSTDNPTSGGSGLDTGTVTGGPLRYYVYGVADQDSVATYSITYSTSASAPAGVTNYRLIGSINTDATNLFTSQDVVTIHAISERELPGGWINFNGSGTVAILDSYNVSALADNGVGDYTISWDIDFNNAFYATAMNGTYDTGGGLFVNTMIKGSGKTAATLGVETADNTAARDIAGVNVVAFGDTRK